MNHYEDLSTEEMFRYIANLEQRVETLRKVWLDADHVPPYRTSWKVQLKEHWPQLYSAINGLL